MQATPHRQALTQSKFIDVSLIELDVLEDAGRVGGTHQCVRRMDDGEGRKTIFNALGGTIMKSHGVNERMGKLKKQVEEDKEYSECQEKTLMQILAAVKMLAKRDVL